MFQCSSIGFMNKIIIYQNFQALRQLRVLKNIDRCSLKWDGFCLDCYIMILLFNESCPAIFMNKIPLKVSGHFQHVSPKGFIINMIYCNPHSEMFYCDWRFMDYNLNVTEHPHVIWRRYCSLKH